MLDNNNSLTFTNLENCGAYFFNLVYSNLTFDNSNIVKSDLNFDTSGFNGGSKIAIVCIYCKPGYAPIFALNDIVDDKNIVTDCTEILNCNLSESNNNTWVNAC